MNAVGLKTKIDLSDPGFSLNPEGSGFIPLSLPEVDSLGGIPRGAITGLIGDSSSGRTSLLLSLLSAVTRHQELCALVDRNDTLDMGAAMRMEIDPDLLLLIRCSASAEHALKATDLLVRSGSFGLVALDLGDMPSVHYSSSYWFRLQRAVEKTTTSLLVIAKEAITSSCLSLILETSEHDAHWNTASGFLNDTPSQHSTLLNGVSLRIKRQKPINPPGIGAQINPRA